MCQGELPYTPPPIPMPIAICQPVHGMPRVLPAGKSASRMHEDLTFPSDAHLTANLCTLLLRHPTPPLKQQPLPPCKTSYLLCLEPNGSKTRQASVLQPTRAASVLLLQPPFRVRSPTHNLGRQLSLHYCKPTGICMPIPYPGADTEPNSWPNTPLHTAICPQV